MISLKSKDWTYKVFMLNIGVDSLQNMLLNILLIYPDFWHEIKAEHVTDIFPVYSSYYQQIYKPMSLV